jgi:hypothetical protein
MPKSESPSLLNFRRAAALAIGVIGANAFADAAGLPIVTNPDRDAGYVFLRILCGMVLAVPVFFALGAVIRGVRAVASVLSESHGRPSVAVVITLIITGAVCLLGAAVLPIYMVHGSSTSVMNAPYGGGSSVFIGTQTPILGVVATLVTLCAGSALISIGVWGSLPARQ